MEHEEEQTQSVDRDQEARDRARRCAEEVDAILRKYRCRIVPQIDQPEPVGTYGACIQIRASYGYIPEIDG